MLKKPLGLFLALLLAFVTLVEPAAVTADDLSASVTVASTSLGTGEDYRLTALPVYDGTPYVAVNNNEPGFTEEQKQDTTAFETYSELDSLGRCNVAFANICPELEPTEERGSISSVTPSGWQKDMDWQRCHLIGFQLAGENANKLNLITGTRYLNVSGMLPFENLVDDYVDETQHHVLYRVTPYFEGDNLVASGVQMEAWSVEDGGEGICFNVYVFNVRPGYVIDYATGVVSSEEKGETVVSLADKSTTYSGKTKKVDSADVTGSTGDVTYVYYTDEACTTKTTTDCGASSKGKAPKEVGTYYVKAFVEEDANFAAAESNVAKLTVKKASSTISIAARTIEYNGKARSVRSADVTGSTGKVTYTYYTNSDCTKKTTTTNGASAKGGAPSKKGTYYVKATVAADAHYKSATSSIVKLKITGATKASKITIADRTLSYSGSSRKVKTAKVTGSTGKVIYLYYTNADCTKKTTEKNGATKPGGAPKKVGTYYVKAYVDADSTYKSATSKVAKLTVKKAEQTFENGTYSKTYKDTTLLLSEKSFSIGATAVGTVAYEKVSGTGKIKVSSDGTVTVPQNLAEGSYSIKVKLTASGTACYKETTNTKTVKITVKAGTVYWTSGGSVYHLQEDCGHLKRSKNVQNGSILESGKTRACEDCLAGQSK